MDELVNMFFADWFNINEAALSDEQYETTSAFINDAVKRLAERLLAYSQEKPGYMTSDQEKYIKKLSEIGLAIALVPGFLPKKGLYFELPKTDVIKLGAQSLRDRIENYTAKKFSKFNDFSDFLNSPAFKISHVKDLSSKLIQMLTYYGSPKAQETQDSAGKVSIDSPVGDSGQTMAGQIAAKSDAEREEEGIERETSVETREKAESFYKTVAERSKVCFANLAKQAEQKLAGIGSAIYNQDPRLGSNLYRNTAYAMYFAKYVLQMIQQNPEKYENILKKTFEVSRSKESTAAKKAIGFDLTHLSDYEAKLKEKLERDYRKLPQFQKSGEGYERGGVGRKAAEDARAQVKAMLQKNKDDLLSGRVKMPEGTGDDKNITDVFLRKDFHHVATQMTINDINAALGKQKESKKAAMARFSQHVAGLKGIHAALQVIPGNKAEAEAELMSDFAKAMRSQIGQDQQLLKVLAIRAFLGLTGLAPGAKGCMTVAEALEHIPSVFRNDIRTRVNLTKETRRAASADADDGDEEDSTTPAGRTVKVGRSCDQILTLRGTSDQEKMNSLVDKFFDYDFPSKDFKQVAQTNIVEKAIFGTIIASINATLSDDKTCDHPTFQFPFAVPGRRYDIYTQKAGKNESYNSEQIFENLRFKYEMNRLVKEIIYDLS